MQKTYWSKYLASFIFIIGGLTISTITNAQTPSPKTVDSLRQVAAEMPDGIPKFELLDDLTFSLREVDLEMAFAVQKEAAKVAEKIKDPSKKIESIYSLGSLQLSSGDFEEAEKNMQQVLTYVEAKDNSLKHLKSRVYNNLGTIARLQERYIAAVEYFQKALKYADKAEIKIDFELNLGTLYYDMGLTDKALEVFLPNIQHLERIPNDAYATEQLVAFYINIAGVYALIKEPKTSIAYCQKILQLWQQGKFANPMYLSQTYANLGNAYMELHQLDSCLVYYGKAVNLLKEVNAPIPTIYGLLNTEETYLQLKHFDKALQAVQEAWAIQTSLGYEPTNYAILLSFAAVVLEAEKAGWAEDKFMPSLREFGFKNLADLFSKLDPEILKIEMPTTRQKAYSYLKNFYKSRGQLEKAYYYQELYMAVTDSIFLLEKGKIAANLTFQYDVEKKEKQLALQEKNIVELEKEKAQKQVWLFGLALLVCLLAMVMLFINNQRKQVQKEKELLQKQEELTRVQLQHTKLLLEQKKQELEKFAEALLQKNELIQELEGQVLDLDSQQQELQQQKIQQLHQQTILTEEDWENFKQLFSEVHTSFLQELQQAFPNLTQAEIRLFILLKLDFSTQHIAGLLGISADSVNKTKYRLRKRLDLDSNKDLRVFIQNFKEEKNL